MSSENKAKTIIAHRGASKDFPENTVRSIREAIKCGADLVEIDVQFTKDGHIVVFHDSSVDRTTDRKGPLKDFTLEEIRRMDAGSFKGDEFRGEKIPTLEEVLDIFLEDGCSAKLLIEIKFSFFSWSKGFLKAYPGLDVQVADMVCKKGLQSKVIIQSFLEEYLLKIREIDSSISLHLLMFPWRSIEKYLEMGFDAYNPAVKFLSFEFVEKVHRAGKKVFVWTVDATHDLHFCMTADVDGIITNTPVESRKYVETFNPEDPAPSRPARSSRSRVVITLLLVVCFALLYFYFGRSAIDVEAKEL